MGLDAMGWIRLDEKYIYLAVEMGMDMS